MSGAADAVHIICENSDIFLSRCSYCEKVERQRSEFPFSFEHLINLAADRRAVEQVFCVGSVPPPTNSVWGHIERITGKMPELYERGAASRKEQAIDQALQVRMLRLGYDFKPPETTILLSGDGKGEEDGIGFFLRCKADAHHRLERRDHGLARSLQADDARVG
jgi:hypothetical protein